MRAEVAGASLAGLADRAQARRADTRGSKARSRERMQEARCMGDGLGILVLAEVFWTGDFLR
jgi:hypothetical protein